MRWYGEWESSDHHTIPLLTYHNNLLSSERHSSAHPKGYFIWPNIGVHVKHHSISEAAIYNLNDITVVPELKKDNKPPAVADVSF